MKTSFFFPAISKHLLFFFCFLNATGQTAVSLNDKAVDKMDIGDVDSAYFLLNEAIKVDSTFFGTYYNRGVLNRELGMTKAAIRDFSLSIRYNDKDTSSYMNRGVLYAKNKEFEAALNDFKHVLEIDPAHDEACFNIGMVYSKTDRYNEAADAFKKCLGIDPDHHTAMFKLATMILITTRDTDKAMEWVNHAIALYDKDPEYFEFRGLLYSMKGNSEACCNDLDRSQALGGTGNPHVKKIREKECNR